MRRFMMIAVILLAAGSAWAIPSDINYQGTLKEKGLPAAGLKSFTFILTDKDGDAYSKPIDRKIDRRPAL